MHHNKLNHYDCIFKALTSECTAVPALKSECTRPIELQSLHKLEWLQLILMEGASEATILRRVAAIIHHNCANICRNGWYQLIVYFLPSLSEMEFQQHETLQNISNKNGIMLFCNQLLITNRPHKGHGSIRKTEKSGQERFPPSSFPLLFSFSSFSSHLLSLTLISSQSTAFVASVAKISKYALWGNNSGSKQAARKPYNWCRPVWECGGSSYYTDVRFGWSHLIRVRVGPTLIWPKHKTFMA